MAVGILAMAVAPAWARSGRIVLRPLPNGRAGPWGITSGPDGNVWFVEENINMIGRTTPAGVITEFPISGTDPRFITAGPDGNLWFTEHGGPGGIGRITTAGSVTEFRVPTPFNNPWAIAAGADGNVWFTEDGNKIGRVTPTGVVTEFPIPTPQALSDGITLGPDGNMWFTEGNNDKLASVSRSGHITEYKMPKASVPTDVVTGADGNLWVTEQGTNAIARVPVAHLRAGDRLQLTQFPIPSPISQPNGIASGPDGNLWFTELFANNGLGNVGRITTKGVITEFGVPGSVNNEFPIDITAGPGDGKMWFSVYFISSLGIISTH